MAMRAIYITRRTATAPTPSEIVENGIRRTELCIRNNAGNSRVYLFCMDNRALKHTQFGASRTAVRENLRARRNNRLFGRHRAESVLYGIAQDVFNNAVLNAVERDNDESPTRRERAKRSRESFSQSTYLVVHPYAKRLKC